MLSEQQKEALNKLNGIQSWEVLEVILEWTKQQIADDTYIVQIELRNIKDVNSSEFTIACLYRLLK